MYVYIYVNDFVDQLFTFCVKVCTFLFKASFKSQWVNKDWWDRLYEIALYFKDKDAV